MVGTTGSRSSGHLGQNAKGKTLFEVKLIFLHLY